MLQPMFILVSPIFVEIILGIINVDPIFAPCPGQVAGEASEIEPQKPEVKATVAPQGYMNF